MSYGGQVWSGGQSGGYDPNMGGINQSGPQTGDSTAMRWAQQNNPQLYAQYQRDKFSREQEQNRPQFGWANESNARPSQWGANTSQLPPQFGGAGGPQVRGGGQQGGYPGQWQGNQGGGQQGGYPGQWGGGQGGMGGGQIAGLMQQMYSPSGQGGGSQGYGGWGGLQTNQGWR